jgi:hypothetical protein
MPPTLICNLRPPNNGFLIRLNNHTALDCKSTPAARPDKTDIPMQRKPPVFFSSSLFVVTESNQKRPDKKNSLRLTAPLRQLFVSKEK